MKYLLVCFLLIISCKSAVSDAGNANIVVGTTANTKAGATVSCDSGLYLIGGLQSWDSIYLHKTVKVTGNFRYVNVEDYYKRSENPLLNSLQAQTFGSNFYSVSNATWQLYKPD